MASDESLVATIAAFAKNIEDQKLLLKAKDEEIAALKAQLKAASLVDTKTDTQPGETKLSRVELAKQQIRGASFACFGGKYRYKGAHPDYAQKQMQLYCCVYTRLDLDVLYMIFHALNCRVALQPYVSDDIRSMYEYTEIDGVRVLYSPVRPFSDRERECIKNNWPFIMSAGSLIRIYCNEKRYKMLIEQGLFDGDISIVPLRYDEE